MRYSQGSAIVTTGRYEFWSSNAIWNRIGVGGWRRSRGLRAAKVKKTEGRRRSGGLRVGEGNSMTFSVGIGDVRWGIGVGLIV
jgi:hypothetical protein